MKKICLNEKFLKEIPMFSNKDFCNVYYKRLGGWSNRSYKVKFKNEAYFVRINNANTVLEINRTAEHLNSCIAYQLGLTERILFLNDQKNIIITKYIENAIAITKKDACRPSIFSKSIKALKLLHTSNKKFVNDLEVFNRLLKIYSFLKAEKYKLHGDVVNLLRIFNYVFKKINKHDFKRAPCHNDTSPYNFLYSNGKIKLVDWEHSGNNDPAWDLAYLSVEAEFSDELDLKMFKLYGQKISSPFGMRFFVYKPLVEFWMMIWIHLQIYAKNKIMAKDQLIKLANNRLKSCFEMVEQDNFLSALKYFRGV